jgi:glycosyltransferase involved in cell wall biosynthesis
MKNQVRTTRDCERPESIRRRPRVVLSAYSCCPNWGSEPGVGWGRATEIARYCDVWVLTECDGNQPRIEAYLEQHGPIPNLEFVYIPPQPWERAIGEKPVLKYVVYRRWLRRAYRVAQRLHAQVGFDIAHHVTFNGFREPSYLYQLGIPFVWGPVGGVQNYPWSFLPGAGFAGGGLEATRSLINIVQLYALRRVRKAARSAAAVFTANSQNEHKIRRTLGVDSTLLCDVGATVSCDEFHRPRAQSDAIRILWAGNLATWKALELLIEALALLPDDVPYELHVLGEGPQRRRWQTLADRNGISRNVQWYGRVTHEEALEQFRMADVFAFTSLRDTTGTVLLEALAAAKPVICLDHQGAGEIVTPQCGIKIPVTNRRKVQRGLCDAIARLQRNPHLCQALGEGARRRAAEYLWSLQARRIAEQYNRILESAGSDARCDLETTRDAQQGVWQEASIEGKIARV